MGVKKKLRQHVDVAGIYGINPFELTPSQLHYLYSGIPRVTARREMFERISRSKLTEDRVYNLHMAIHEDEDKAQQEVAKFIIHSARNKQ